MARAVQTVEASGARIADRVAIDEAHDRIARQASASAVWVELDRDCGASMDQLLAEISKGAADGRYAAVVSSTAALIPGGAYIELPDTGHFAWMEDEERAQHALKQALSPAA